MTDRASNRANATISLQTFPLKEEGVEAGVGMPTHILRMFSLRDRKNVSFLTHAETKP